MVPVEFHEVASHQRFDINKNKIYQLQCPHILDLHIILLEKKRDLIHAASTQANMELRPDKSTQP